MNDELKQFLETRRQEIDTALELLLPQENMRPRDLKSAMKYAVFSGGKRLRPILCQLACYAVCGDKDAAIYPAVAVELLHSYTLVHDDLPCMDDDDTRRGKPTVHKKYNEALAVLVGDALQTLAFEVLVKTPPTAKYSTADMVRYLTSASGHRGIIGGQVEDIAAVGKPQTKDIIEYVHQHKTADLFMAAVCLGAMAGNASDDEYSALEIYAQNIGIAFQIVDDILDKDKGDAELSCLSVLSVKEAKDLAKLHVSIAKNSISFFQSDMIKYLIYLADYILERTY